MKILVNLFLLIFLENFSLLFNFHFYNINFYQGFFSIPFFIFFTKKKAT